MYTINRNERFWFLQVYNKDFLLSYAVCDLSHNLETPTYSVYSEAIIFTFYMNLSSALFFKESAILPS